MQKKAKELCPCGRRPATTPERKGASFYEKLEKLLACLLVSLMALDRVHRLRCQRGRTDSPKPSNAESAKALCEYFKNCEHFEKMDYSEDLSEKAYNIANWAASTSVSCKPSEDKTELYRWAHVDNVVKTYLEKKSYATAFENMGMGILGH